MTQTYKELLQQREALELAIAQARQNEISSAPAPSRDDLYMQLLTPGTRNTKH